MKLRGDVDHACNATRGEGDLYMNDTISLFVPGRLCLFGEHSDWAGLNRTINPDVIPGCAIVTGIEQGIYATARKNETFVVKSKLEQYDGRAFECEMNMVKLRNVAREGGFFSYVAGVASYMSEWYQVGGIELVIESMTLPMKSGLSSSAAICVLVVRAFNELYDLHLNTLGLMNIAYWGEQRTPSQCGRLDQACAFGVKPVSMTFDGNEIDVEPISVRKPLYYVFADLMAGKDTVKILNDLNSAYPYAKNEKEQAVHEALGLDNILITDKAKEYLSEGNAEKLGELMIEAQDLFDKKIAPMCPEELTAPVLHSVLSDENIRKYTYGAKGVGSQGDGTVQFLARSAVDQKALISYLENERKMTAYPLTLKPESDSDIESTFAGDVYVFGARSVAVGFIRASRECCDDVRIRGCVVSSLEENPSEIEGLEVVELKEFSRRFADEEKHAIRVVVATPIYAQGEICDTLRIFGFDNVMCLDPVTEAELMHRYYRKKDVFASVKDVDQMADHPVEATVLTVRNIADKRLRIHYEKNVWEKDIQVGAALTDIRLCELNDMTGDNISEKNPQYYGLTALYWMWKNMVTGEKHDEYFGICQYRRVLDIDEADLKRIASAGVDVILPYPMIHVPDIGEHHARYTSKEEWELLLEAVNETAPEYTDSYQKIFSGQYFYNYCIFLAKGTVVDELCSWMFPILSRFEELCRTEGVALHDRHISYLGESLMTWFFMRNADRLKIMHSGRMLRV